MNAFITTFYFQNGFSLRDIGLHFITQPFFFKQKVLFTGDALFCQSIGRTDFPDSNHLELITAIREKLFTLPDDTVVYPGHREKTTIGFEKRYNMYVR